MKTIANCDPVEFLVQTNKIRHKVKTYLDKTKILDIRKNQPELTGNETKQEKRKLQVKQGKENLSKMLDAMLDEHPTETAGILGLLCFIEPADIKNHKGIEFLTPAIEILQSEEVISFFISLAKLGQTNISDAQKT